MAKSKWRARKRKGGGEAASTATHPADQPPKVPSPPTSGPGRPRHEPPPPFWFRPVATYLLGVGYILTAIVLLIQNHLAETRIGAACEDVCGGASLGGISLEWWGGLLMAGVLGARWLAGELPRPGIRQFLVLLALGHAGASFAFAASQWLGIVDVCIFCQVASAFSIAVALTCLPVIRATFEAPLLPAAQAIGLGVAGVLAIWPFLDGVQPEEAAMDVAPPSAWMLEESELQQALARWVRSLEGGEPGANGAELPEQLLQAIREGRQDASAAPADPRPDDWVADETTQRQALAAAMDSLTIGNPEAPYEFVMITDFTCNICRAFEEDHLPAIIQEGVYSGRVRVRFLLARSGAAINRPFYELVASSSLALAGLPPEQATNLIRGGSAIVTSQQGIARAQDDGIRDKALREMHRISDEVGWDAVTEEHAQQILRLRQAYFPGRSGTPGFVMVRGGLDFDNLPPEGSDDVLALYGFYPAGHFLEFAGLR